MWKRIHDVVSSSKKGTIPLGNITKLCGEKYQINLPKVVRYFFGKENWELTFLWIPFIQLSKPNIVGITARYSCSTWQQGTSQSIPEQVTVDVLKTRCILLFLLVLHEALPQNSYTLRMTELYSYWFGGNLELLVQSVAKVESISTYIQVNKLAEYELVPLTDVYKRLNVECKLSKLPSHGLADHHFTSIGLWSHYEDVPVVNLKLYMKRKYMIKLSPSL